MGRQTSALVLVAVVAGSAQAQEPVHWFDAPNIRVVNSVDFAPDGDRLYLALLYHEYLAESSPDQVAGAPETALFASDLDPSGEWGPPSLLEFSGEYQDYEPTLSADGRLMVFNSRRPYPDGRVPDTNDLWMSVAGVDGRWGDPRRIAELTTFEQEESYASLADDGSMVFLRGTPDDEVAGGIQFDLHQAAYRGDGFEDLGRHPVSTDRWGEGDPWLGSDGSYLIFTRWDDEVGWRETVDLYVSFHSPSGWSEPEPLSELNTSGAEFGAAVSHDERWLYFKSGSQLNRVPLSDVLGRRR